jgi:hypothetical protein
VVATRIASIVAFMLLVGACGKPEIYERRSSEGPQPSPQLLAKNISTIFRPETDPRDIAVTAARPAQELTLSGWLMCVRARVRTLTGTDAIETYAVFVQRNDIVIRRRAEPADRCEDFQRLDLSSAKAN